MTGNIRWLVVAAVVTVALTVTAAAVVLTDKNSNNAGSSTTPTQTPTSPAPTSSSPPPSPKPKTTSPWKLAWSDEFNGKVRTGPQSGKWTFQVDNYHANGELQEYTQSTSNASHDGSGNLAITARTSGAGKYTSARLITDRKFTPRYGRLEARIKVPPGKGLWPAFWAMRAPKWSTPRSEIDVMEHLGREPSKAFGRLHGGADSSGKLRSFPFHSYELPGGQDFSNDFHIFSADWYPDRIEFAVDHKVYAVDKKSTAPRGSWTFDAPVYLILNLAVGGTWPGSPDAKTQFPARMLIDYVRVYKHA